MKSILKNRPLVLLGMMGAGKSYVGKVLAQRLDWRFVDMDSFIENKEGRSVSEIFDQGGEAYFRSVEANVLANILQDDKCVISTGGGVVLRDENRRIINDGSFSVWIKSDVEVLYSRLKNDVTRPLLRTEDLKVRLHDLIDQRDALYSCADVHIENNAQGEDAVLDVVDGIITAYKEYVSQNMPREGQ